MNFEYEVLKKTPVVALNAVHFNWILCDVKYSAVLDGIGWTGRNDSEGTWLHLSAHWVASPAEECPVIELSSGHVSSDAGRALSHVVHDLHLLPRRVETPPKVDFWRVGFHFAVDFDRLMSGRAVKYFLTWETKTSVKWKSDLLFDLCDRDWETETVW